MMEIGRMHRLKAVRTGEFGMLLRSEDDTEVLLPQRDMPETLAIGDELDVFVYRDSKDRLTATTDTPAAMLDDFAYLEVETVTAAGAFMNWGLAKGLFVPFSEQSGRMIEGQSYLVRICLDEETDRLFASNLLDDFVCEFAEGYEHNDEVDIIIAKQTSLGFKVLVDGGCWGILYKDEIFADLKLGQIMKGYVKPLRDDKRLDICLQKTGQDRRDDAEQQILLMLEENDDFLPLTKKSAPDDIYATIGMSKKSFKRGLSVLSEKGFITVDAGRGVRLDRNANGLAQALEAIKS